jgi:hypothetical protein
LDATLHSIEACTRQTDIDITSFANFRFGVGQAVSSRIALEPGWTPFCIDVERRQMLFLDVPPEADLSQAAFVYAMQARFARRALLVPFAALEELASSVPAPQRLAFVFNIARCGSTLVNAMLNGVEGVWSLSEPDPFFDLVMRRHLLDPAEVPDLVHACVRLSFRPPPARRVHTMAIKFRSQSLLQAEHFYAAFPGAAFVFLYRDGVSWTRSFWYFLQNLGMPPVLAGESLRFHWWMESAAADPALLQPYLDADGSVPIERVQAPGWAMHIEEYLRLFEAGVPFLAIRYNELQADREATAARLLRHCGLPTAAHVGVLDAFARDSQAGTVIARDRRDASPFTDAAADEFRATLARHPRIKSPDLLLPDIYSAGSPR